MNRRFRAAELTDVTQLPLSGRVALVAGAARGAGRGIARALGKAGAIVYCTGRSAARHPKGMDRPETIDETAALIERAGGRALAVGVDHTNEQEVARVATRVRSDAGRLDVLVNSILGTDPVLNWEQRFLGSQRGAGATRLGMAMELAQTGGAAGSLSPGFLRSEAVLEHFGVREENWRDAIAKDPYFAESETPWLVGRAVASLAADPDVRRKSGLTHFASDLAREYGFTDIDGSGPGLPELVRCERSGRSPRRRAWMKDQRFLVWARYCQIHHDPARRNLALLLGKALGLHLLRPGSKAWAPGWRPHSTACDGSAGTRSWTMTPRTGGKTVSVCWDE